MTKIRKIALSTRFAIGICVFGMAVFAAVIFFSVSAQCPGGPCPDRIQRNGGRCIVGSTGAVDCTAAPGQNVTLNGTAVLCNGVPCTGGGGGITSVNGQAGPAITLASGSTGTDFNLVSAANTITFNIPSASFANRGLMTIGSQVFNGAKQWLGSAFIFGGTNGADAANGTWTVRNNVNQDLYQFSSGRAQIAANRVIGWTTSNNDSGGTVDIGIGRFGVDTLEINDGVPGNRRDIFFRNGSWDNQLSGGASSLLGTNDLIVGNLASVARLDVNPGTITTNLRSITNAVTWNNAGIDFTNVFSNVTDTASGASSLLFDFQVGGVSQLSLDKTGFLFANTLLGAPAASLINDVTAGGNVFAAAVGTNTAGNNDLRGILVTNGGGTAAISFSGTYTSAPVCVVTKKDVAPVVPLVYTVSTTQLSITTADANSNYDYICMRRN